MKKNNSSIKQPVKKNTVASKPANTFSPVYVLGIILLYVCFIYSNSLNNAILTFDDNEYFQNYPEVLNLSWQSIQKYFSTYYVIMYQPLPVLSFAINYHFTGMDTFPMHMVNLFFHLANIVLVFKFIQSLTKSNWGALLVAFLFGIHPMNVEAVSWISARSSSMYTFFYLLALINYLKYLNTYKLKNIAVTFLFFVLSLFSKSQAVTLPVVLLLLDYYYNRKLVSQKVIIEKIPFLILSIVFGIITLSNAGTMRNITEGMIISYSPVDIFFLVCYSFVFYLFKLILPVNLCAVYVYPPKDGSLLPYEYYLSAVAIAALLFVLFKARKNKNVMLCVGMFLITIAINIQIIPSRLFIVTDRYGYFPYIGLFLVPVFFINNLKEKKIYFYNKYFPYMVTLLVFFGVYFSYVVYERNKVWKDDVPFMTDILEKNPPVGYIYRAYGNRGMAYKVRGQSQEAINDFTEAIKLKPDDGRNFYNRALTFATMKNNEAALEDFNRAEKLDGKQALIFSNRSQIKFLMNDTLGAEADCKKTIELDPTNIDAYNTLANIDFIRKDYVNCEKHLTDAIKIKPDFSIAIKNRGLLYLQLNRKEDACSDFLNASNLNNQEAKQLFTQYCK